IIVALGERLHRERHVLRRLLAHRGEPLAEHAQLLVEFLVGVRGHGGILPAAGSRSQKVLPDGSFGSTPTSPFMLSTRCFTIEGPRPVPPASRERLGSAR